MATVYLGLGSNLGEREKSLSCALSLLSERVGVVRRCSDFMATEPWGFFSDHSFLNAAVELGTTLSPQEVLHVSQQIERELGREEKSRQGVYHDRTIDIDILFYVDDNGETLICEEKGILSLPHPLSHLRRFVLEPLCQIAPDLWHPLQKHTVKELLRKLQAR